MFTFDGIRSPRRGHVIRYSAGVPHKIIVDDVVVATDDGELRALDLSPDGRWLALAYSDGIDLYELTF